MTKRSGILCGDRGFGVMLRRWFLMVGILAILCTLGTRCPAMSNVYSEDGKYLAYWRPDLKKVSVWNLESGQCSQFDFEKPTAPYRPEWKVCVEWKQVTFDLRKEVCGTMKFWETGWSPDGRYYVLPNSRQIQDRDFDLKIWDVEAGKQIQTYRSGEFSYSCWSPDSRQLFAADRQQFIEHDGEPPRMEEIPKLPKVADVEYRVHFWDLETQKEVRVLTTGRVSMLPEMEKQRRELEAEAARNRAIYEERKRMRKERSLSPAPVPVQTIREL